MDTQLIMCLISPRLPLRCDDYSALVVDGKVVSYGKVLKTDEIVKILQKVRG